MHWKHCSFSPDLSFPNNNMRGRTVVSKVLQNMGILMKGMFKDLWEKPNLVLR